MTHHRPEDFASVTPPVRIIGTETEYHNQAHQPPQVTIDNRLARLGLAHVGEYYTNGARIYNYQGLEYAAPECAGPRLAADADFKGIAIIHELTRPEITKRQSGLRFPVLRNAGSYSVRAHKLESRGYHQNHLIRYELYGRRRELHKAILSSFLATRIIWDGSGLVTHNGYRLSQKAPGIGEPVRDSYGNRTEHGKKPLAAYHASDDKSHDKIGLGWGLLETRCADSHMSYRQTETSLAITSLVLRLLEQKVMVIKDLDSFILDKPIDSLYNVNTSFGLGKTRLFNGNIDTALGVQKRFADAISTLSTKIQLPADELAAVDQFQRLCSLLQAFSETGELKPLVKDIEWAAKWRMISHKLGENALHENFEHAVAYDFAWHRIDKHSIGLQFYNQIDPSQAEHFRPEKLGLPPAGSRAAARSAAIRDGRCTKVDWSTVTVNGHQTHLHDYWDPELPEEFQLRIAS